MVHPREPRGIYFGSEKQVTDDYMKALCFNVNFILDYTALQNVSEQLGCLQKLYFPTRGGVLQVMLLRASNCSANSAILGHNNSDQMITTVLTLGITI